MVRTKSRNGPASLSSTVARYTVFFAVLLVTLAAPSHAQVVDTVAKIAFGQPNLTSNTPATTQTGLRSTWAAAFDSAGRLYIVDFGSNRVVRHDNPRVDTVADAVYGQPNFTSSTAATTATGLSGPSGVFIDSAGRLYILEYSNNRIVRHDNPLADTVADAVYGQPNFTSSTAATTATGLRNPVGIWEDTAGRLYIADYQNNRVIRHDNPLADTVADAVYGQPNFTSSTATTTVTGLRNPTGVTMDSAGRLYITEYQNHRVVRHDNPLADTVADAVFGQPNFTSNSFATTTTGLNSPVSSTVDSAGRLYICELGNNRIVRHDNPFTDTVADVVYGQATFTTSTSGVSSSQLAQPFGVVSDSTDAIMIPDRNNNRLLGFGVLFAAYTISNNIPFISPAVPAQTRTEDTAAWTVALTAFGSDSDAADVPVLFWSVTGGGTKAVASMNDSRTLRIAPIADANGSETVTLRLSDNKDTTLQVLSITLTAVNDTPRAGALTIADTDIRPSDSVLLAIIGSTDTDIATNGDTLTYLWSVLSGPGGAFTDTTLSSTYFRPLASSDGIDVLRVTVTDSVGASDSKTTSMLVDSYPPSSFGPTSPAAIFETTSTTITFTWSAATDTSSGVDSYRIQIDTAGTFVSLVVDSATGLSLTGTRTLAANDTYFWRILAADKVGNIAVSTSRIVKIDTKPPSIPALVTIINNAETKVPLIRLDWTDASDSLTGVLSYRIQMDTLGTFAGALVLDATQSAAVSETTLALAEARYFWRVSATDSLGNTSAFSAAETFVVNRTAPKILASLISTSAPDYFYDPGGAVNGVSYAFYNGSWSNETGAIPYFFTQVPIKTGLVTNFDTSPRTDTRNIGFIWRCSLNVPADGTYTFFTTSNDGSSLYIDDNRIVNNEFYQAKTERSGNVTLRAGRHAIMIDYFNIDLVVGGVDGIEVRWSGPGIGKQLIPDTALFLSSADTVFFNNAGLGANQTETVNVTASLAKNVVFPQRFGDAGLTDTVALIQYTYSIEVGLTDTATALVASDTAGNADTFTITWVRDVINPPAPALTIPVQGQLTGDSTPFFQWAASNDTQAGTRGYILQLAGDAGFSLIVESSVIQTGVTYNLVGTGLSDSLYFWRVVAYDKVSNYETSVVRSFNVDSVTPSIASIRITSTAAAFFFDDTPVVPGFVADTVYYNPTGAGAGQTVSILVQVLDGNETTVSGTSIFTPVTVLDFGFDRETYTLSYTLPLDSSSQTLTILAADVSGRFDTAFVRFEADTAAPIMGALTAPTNALETTATSLTFRWAAAVDTGAGVGFYRIQIDDDSAFGSPNWDSALGGALIFTETIPANFRWYWRVRATDSVSNTGTSVTQFFTIDTLPPVAATLTSPAANHDTTATTITFTWAAAADSLTSIASYRLQVDTANSFTSLVADSSAELSLAGTLTLPANDSYFWRVTAADGVGNTAASLSRLLRIDTASPLGLTQQTPVAPTDTSVTTILFTWTAASDSGVGLASYRLQLDTANTFVSPVVDSSTGLAINGTLTVAANDTFFWRVTAVDSIGNTAVTTGRLLRVDTVAPSIVTQLTPAAGTETRATTIVFAWSAAADSIGVASYRLQLDTSNTFASLVVDSSAGLALTGTRMLAGIDTYFWRVIATDSAGNTNASVTAGRLLVVDTTLPTAATLVTPLAATKSVSQSVLFTWTVSTDTGSGVGAYRLQVDTANTFAGLVFDSTTAFASSGTLTFATNDTYYWRVVTTDDAQNTTASVSRQIIIDTNSADTTPPPVSALITPPTNTETQNVSVLFRWTLVTDTGLGVVSGVATYTLEVDTEPGFIGALTASVIVGPAVNTAQPTLPANDTYFWRVIVTDLGGNRSDSSTTETRVIVIDTVLPTAPTLVSPANGAETTRVSIRFVWSASTDTGSGIRDYRLQVASNAVFSTSFPPDDTFTSSLVDVYVSGATETTPLYLFNTTDTFYWRIAARDDAGNVSGWSAERIFVRRAPTETQIPLSVAGFRITTLESGVLRLEWDPSPSPDVVQYVIQWDSGLGTDANILLAILNTKAGDTGVLDVGPLPPGFDYRFKLTPVDSAGNFGQSANVTGRVDTKAYTFAKPTLSKPIAGDRLPVANLVQLLATLDGISAQVSAVSTLTYQVRTSQPVGAWTNMAVAAGVTNNANPVTTGFSKDEIGFYRFVWNATGLAFDSYEIRVVATSSAGETRASTAVGIRLVDTSVDSVTTFAVVTADSFTLQAMINVNRPETIAITNNPDTQSVQIFLPNGAFTNALDTANIYIIVSFTHASPFDIALNGTTDVKTLDVVEVKLSNGDTLLSGGKTALVTLTFRDDNSDGFVDGSRVRWNTLRILRHSGLPGGVWTERPIVARGDPSPGVPGFLQTTTEHFSFFQLVGTATSANLGNFLVAPNPFRPNDGNGVNGQNFTGAVGTGIYFLNLPAAVCIEVYTLTGRKVFNFSTSSSTGQVQWDVKNDDRRPVASGVYLYVVTDLATNQRVTGKLVVIR